MLEEIGLNKQLVARFYKAFEKHDPTLLDGLLDPDWQVYPLAAGQTPGRLGWEPGLLALFKAFPDIHCQIEELIAEDDRVAVRCTFSGTHRGNFLRLAPTGRVVQFAAHDIHRVAGGRIMESWHIEDWMSVFAQLGTPPRF